jgi:hypothetical protein
MRKTRTRKRGVASIPELRRSFEHIEAFLRDRIRRKDPKDKIIRDLRKEWRLVFLKPLDKVSAEALYDDAPKGRMRGGAAIAGAPLDYTTQPGLYLAPGGLPQADGGLPLSQQGGAYGSFLQYVSHGFWNPEMAITSDPVKGQPAWPVPYPETGSNTFKAVGGRRRRTRRRGGSLLSTLSNAISHPIPSSAPPTPLQDAQDMWHGAPVGASPDQVQRAPVYQLGEVHTKAIQL